MLLLLLLLLQLSVLLQLAPLTVIMLLVVVELLLLLLLFLLTQSRILLLLLLLLLLYLLLLFLLLLQGHRRGRGLFVAVKAAVVGLLLAITRLLLLPFLCLATLLGTGCPAVRYRTCPQSCWSIRRNRTHTPLVLRKMCGASV